MAKLAENFVGHWSPGPCLAPRLPCPSNVNYCPQQKWKAAKIITKMHFDMHIHRGKDKLLGKVGKNAEIKWHCILQKGINYGSPFRWTGLDWSDAKWPLMGINGSVKGVTCHKDRAEADPGTISDRLSLSNQSEKWGRSLSRSWLCNKHDSLGGRGLMTTQAYQCRHSQENENNTCGVGAEDEKDPKTALTPQWAHILQHHVRGKKTRCRETILETEDRDRRKPKYPQN